MKIFNKILLLGFIITLGGCKDGNDGKAFLRIRTIIEPTSVTIYNPDIPSDFNYDVYYETQPGSYQFEYIDHNNNYHPLPGELNVIDIVVAPGQSSSFLNSGEDGRNVYIDLILLSTGALVETFDILTIPSELNYEE